MTPLDGVHSIAPAEVVRETILALAQNPERAVGGAVGPSLTPSDRADVPLQPGSWRPKSATRWSAKGAKKNSMRWSPRPARSTDRCAGTPPLERDRRTGKRAAASRPAVTRSYPDEWTSSRVASMNVVRQVASVLHRSDTRFAAFCRSTERHGIMKRCRLFLPALTNKSNR